MICFLALVAFGILGIFSAAYRKLALEAFDCVFKKVRLKPCDSGLDKRLKSKATGKLMKKSPRLARFVYRNFELVSALFTLLLIVSTVYSAIGVYNFVAYGNCNGKGSQEMCVYAGLENSLKVNVGCESPLCQDEKCSCKSQVSCEEGATDSCVGSCGIVGDSHAP